MSAACLSSSSLNLNMKRARFSGGVRPHSGGGFLRRLRRRASDLGRAGEAELRRLLAGRRIEDRREAAGGRRLDAAVDGVRDALHARPSPAIASVFEHAGELADQLVDLALLR